MEVYVLPEAEREKWRQAVKPFSDSLITEMGDFGQELLEAAEKVNAKYPY